MDDEANLLASVWIRLSTRVWMLHFEDDRGARRSTETKVLVCGACERVLPGPYAHPGEADEAADAHAYEEHEGGPLVILPVRPEAVEEHGEEFVVSFAVRLQERLSDNR